MSEDKLVDIFIVVAIIVTIVLKITNVITIPWLWLLAPIWIPLGIGCILASILCLYFVFALFRNKKEIN